VNVKSLPAELKDADLFIASLTAVYGLQRTEEIVQQLAKPSRMSFWFNPLSDVDQNVEGLGVPFTPVQGLPRVWSTNPNSGLSSIPQASSGHIYIQNPSSKFAVQVLAPAPHEEILDLAAAPGGKTIAMAAAMENTGRIAAVEPVKGRFHRLRANTTRCGVTNVDFYQRDGRGVGRAVPERFDRVLLDAPCSSQARMRWFAPHTYAHWSRHKLKESQRKQKSLLRSAYAALKPGGVLVYCTCSFSVEENEQVVQHLLKRTDVQIEPIQHTLPNVLPGVIQSQGKDLPAALAGTLRIIPNDVWDGFFVARMRKPQ
jgi:NOL1/NOP2/sun family putative RNA methylase